MFTDSVNNQEILAPSLTTKTLLLSETRDLEVVLIENKESLEAAKVRVLSVRVLFNFKIHK